MTRVLVPPERPCVVADFDPDDDVLVVALPGDGNGDGKGDGGLDHTLGFRHDRARGFLEVALTHRASGARFLIRLPGISHLDPSAIAVMSLADAAALESALATAPAAAAAPAPAAVPATPAALTGEGLYPSRKSAQPGQGPHKLAILHRHNWYRDGPPEERFFDLSDPRSELDIRLSSDSDGPIYAIRLSEQSDTRPDPGGKPGTRPAPPDDGAERHVSIILAQTAPGTPRLSTGLLAQWFATRLGTPEFRAIVWVWLGSEGHYIDPDTGRRARFGAINTDPSLAIHGPLAGSIAIDR